ncbi:mannose-1-phosphate guanylyltransferase [Robertkochia aurantiaca]|uniref:mannose-1-phosphate guanylyltransferase n=1 Tax=Robertkochia aurantiaca TaxID=2873700 RepID=UPI001CCDF347|nr:sugar phosphate nucleotidyltransferase [Robertkochia sp. 3YJGBD-33]
MPRIINTILSGGFGTRLWPLSTPENPKQFLKIFDNRSLFQHTVKRNEDLVDALMILTNEKHYEIAKEQIQELDRSFDHVVLEPVPRNTAPAIALAAFSVDPEDILFVTPSDHMIGEGLAYTQVVNRAIELAKDNFLVTFSIKPEHPETGFGYIEFVGDRVISFREKPDEKTAKQFLEKGNFYWNSGMFCFKAGLFLSELQKHSPDIFEKTQRAFQGGVTADLMREIPEDSVDYAVFEKSAIIKTVAADFEWNDLGSFDAFFKYFNSFGDNESVKPLKGLEVRNVDCYGDMEFLGVGIENLNVVQVDNKILILPKGESQLVKKLFKKYDK